jgi:hypothetical protein
MINAWLYDPDYEDSSPQRLALPQAGHPAPSPHPVSVTATRVGAKKWPSLTWSRRSVISLPRDEDKQIARTNEEF